jgi:acetylglutamate kinase
VAQLNQHGATAVGLSGKDGNLIIAEQETSKGDIGYVGKVVQVNPQLIHTLTRDGYVPVISSVAIGIHGESYNINADTAAGALAGALHATKLILMTDVEGLYQDFADKSSLITSLTVAEVEEMLASGNVDRGMIPKLEACVTAIKSGVSRAHIIDGRQPHALLTEIFTDKGIGTMIYDPTQETVPS